MAVNGLTRWPRAAEEAADLQPGRVARRRIARRSHSRCREAPCIEGRGIGDQHIGVSLPLTVDLRSRRARRQLATSVVAGPPERARATRRITSQGVSEGADADRVEQPTRRWRDRPRPAAFDGLERPGMRSRAGRRSSGRRTAGSRLLAASRQPAEDHRLPADPVRQRAEHQTNQPVSR